MFLSKSFLNLVDDGVKYEIFITEVCMQVLKARNSVVDLIVVLESNEEFSNIVEARKDIARLCRTLLLLMWKKVEGPDGSLTMPPTADLFFIADYAGKSVFRRTAKAVLTKEHCSRGRFQSLGEPKS